MFCLPTQINIAGIPPITKWAGLFHNRLRKLDISLLAETVLIMVTAILAIRVLSRAFPPKAVQFAIPGILAAAALIPTAIRGRKFAEIGFNVKGACLTLPVVWWTCVVIFPIMFLGLWVLKTLRIELPLLPILPQKSQWACWLFYQFMYVAVVEETFFRGYVQSNILTLMSTIIQEKYCLQQWISIVLSAACFAVAHILVHGQIISGLTFLPGLVFGWLFIRTKSLLGPILLHGLANTCYFVIAGLLT